MGLNTGVADVHNLAWKLHAVEDGWASPALLGTYETERRPVAQANCHQSTTNALEMIHLYEALGVQAGTTGGDLAAVLADPARRPAIDAAVQAQATHFDMLGLQLGYVYADGALARDGEPPAPIDDPRRFAPRGEVGARLPHGWLADGRSTLDLVPAEGLTLITAGAHEAWGEAATRLAAPVHHVRLGEDAVVSDEWRALAALGDGGALLVRPDQHVAWRSDAPPADPAAALSAAFTTAFG